MLFESTVDMQMGRHKRLALPSLITGVISIMGTLTWYGVQFSTLWFCAFLTVLSFASAYWATRQCQAVIVATVDESNRQERRDMRTVKSKYIEGLDQLCVEVLPVWSGQVEMARSHTEESITVLTNRFADLSQRIRFAVSASQNSSVSRDGGTDTGIVSLLHNGETDLNSITRSLRSSMKEKESLLHQIESLSRFTDELKGMAKVVGELASQTNLLALNAAIEAARAGDVGRGFAVVADEVRNLSTLSGETGKKITETVETVNKAIADTLHVSRKYAQQDAEMVARSELVIENVLSSFHGTTSSLNDSAELLRQETELISREIEEVIVALQFQDRVSQILCHVRADFEKLKQHLAEADHDLSAGKQPRSLEPNEWLQALASTYTMQEQHTTHSGRSSQAETSQPEVTFF